MPAIFDKERNTWIAQFYYSNYKGERKRKRKRGFKLKRDALAYEHDFLANHTNDNTTTFKAFVNEYTKDILNRVKESTYELKYFILYNKILPYFKDFKLSEITSKDIRNWQNSLLAYRNKDGKPYSPTYLKTIDSQMRAIMNFAVSFYDLKENPCEKAGSIGRSKAEEMHYWTLNDYQQFILTLPEKKSLHKLAITFLFFTGVRIGELLAITPKDIDFKAHIAFISKTLVRVKGKYKVSTPKTRKSNRIVAIPQFLNKELYLSCQLRNIEETARIFPFTSNALGYTIKKYAKKAGVYPIRLHDFRHSHASLLINSGFSANLVADRLGHDKIETTLEIYSHLYPNITMDVANRLDEIVTEAEANNLALKMEKLDKNLESNDLEAYKRVQLYQKVKDDYYDEVDS